MTYGLEAFLATKLAIYVMRSPAVRIAETQS